MATTRQATAATEPTAAATEPGTAGFPEHRITVERYLKMVDAGVFADGEPIFLWDGKLVEEMTKGERHNFASDSLVELLVKLVPRGWFVRVGKPVAMRPRSMPEPDLMIVRGAVRDYLRRQTVPGDVLICIEVADSSLLQDSRVKLPAYARAGIPTTWIVNLRDNRLEFYEQPAGSRYTGRRDYGHGDEVPVVLDGREVGRIAAGEFLP